MFFPEPEPEKNGMGREGRDYWEAELSIPDSSSNSSPVKTFSTFQITSLQLLKECSPWQC